MSSVFGKERSYLWFATAARFIEKGDVQSGRNAIDRGLADALSKDPDGALTLILQLKNEYVRSSALVAFVSELTD